VYHPFHCWSLIPLRGSIPVSLLVDERSTVHTLLGGDNTLGYSPMVRHNLNILDIPGRTKVFRELFQNVDNPGIYSR